MNREIAEKLLMYDKNIIVNGRESIGKTANVMFPLISKVIENNESLIVLDSKEEYISKYTPLLKRNDYNIIIMNFKDLERSNSWNPLEYPYDLYKRGEKDKALDLIEKLGREIFASDSSDKFWDIASKDLFTGLVVSLFEDASISEINLNSVASMLMTVNKKIDDSDYLTEYFKLKNPNSLPYISVASTLQAPNETKLSIFAIAIQKLRLFVSRELLSHLLNRTSFKMEDIINKPTAIFVVTKSELNYINGIASMFLEQILNIINMHNNVRYNIFLDNLESLENNYNFTELMNLDLDEKLKFIVSVRSLEDFEKEKPKQLKEFSNVVNVSENSVLVSIKDNEFKYKYENEYKHVIFIKNDADYPVLRKEKINIFNLEGYVNSYKMGLKEKEKQSQKERVVVDVESLLKVIDKKIEDLENKGKRKYNSVLEKFKI